MLWTVHLGADGHLGICITIEVLVVLVLPANAHQLVTQSVDTCRIGICCWEPIDIGQFPFRLVPMQDVKLSAQSSKHAPKYMVSCTFSCVVLLEDPCIVEHAASMKPLPMQFNARNSRPQTHLACGSLPLLHVACISRGHQLCVSSNTKFSSSGPYPRNASVYL